MLADLLRLRSKVKFIRPSSVSFVESSLSQTLHMEGPSSILDKLVGCQGFELSEMVLGGPYITPYFELSMSRNKFCIHPSAQK